MRPGRGQRHTGYAVGGTSPFGTRKPLPVFVERTILELERVYINGDAAACSWGGPGDLTRVLGATRRGGAVIARPTRVALTSRPSSLLGRCARLSGDLVPLAKADDRHALCTLIPATT